MRRESRGHTHMTPSEQNLKIKGCLVYESVLIPGERPSSDQARKTSTKIQSSTHAERPLVIADGINAGELQCTLKREEPRSMDKARGRFVDHFGGEHEVPASKTLNPATTTHPANLETRLSTWCRLQKNVQQLPLAQSVDLLQSPSSCSQSFRLR